MSRSEQEWNDAYNEAMQWRDWDTCDQLLAERHPTPKPKRFRRFGAFRVWVRIKGLWFGLFP